MPNHQFVVPIPALLILLLEPLQRVVDAGQMPLGGAGAWPAKSGAV
jgi:hypothetical protein